MSTALVVPEHLSLEETMNLGGVLAKSGYFKDASDQAKAVVKVLAGRELGFGPIASMTGIAIVQGKPSLGANLIAAQIKRHPRYDYDILEGDDEVCTIAIQQDGKTRGAASFTIEDAKRAGLAGKDNWKKYTSDMLFARAITRAARRYAPDVFSGVPVYTPEELGAEVSGETGEVIDVTPTVTPQEAPDPITGDTLLVKVNNATAGYYNHTSHMSNAIRLELGAEDWDWPDPHDREAWNEAYLAAVSHSKKEAA